MINQKMLNENAKLFEPIYLKLMEKSSPYTIKGIFHSEMLMFLTLTQIFAADQIIESGRANGQSTEMIGRYAYKYNKLFYSIESSQRDAEVAEERLKKIDIAARLMYGDSFELMEDLIKNKRTIILIDGPKGSNMLRLCHIMLQNPYVIGVALHDSHWEGSVRKHLEAAYKNKYLISDDPEFVESFKHLDEECWRIHPFAPYTHGSYISGEIGNLHPSKSYAGTLSFVEAG